MAEELHANKITVSRIELLVKLNENLAQHEKDFNEARTGFQAAVVADLQDKLTALLGGAQADGSYLHAALDVPVSYAREYHRAIEMLKMSKQDDVVLSVGQFTQYVLDEWSWKDSFSNTAAVYGAQGPIGAKGLQGAPGKR